MVLRLKDRLIYNIKDNVMKLRQVQKTKLESILDDIEEKLEEMQTEEYQLNTEDYDLNKDLFKLLRLIDMARKELKKITSSVIKLRAELENINQALQKLIDKEIQEIEEDDRYWNQQADLEKESA